MKIRKASRADWGAIERLIRAFPDKLMQTHLPRPSEFFVALEGGTIIGCCALEVYSKRLAELRSLAVDKDSQGKGAARALIERCIKEARKKEIHEILTITGEPKLFEKFSFDAFKNEKYALLKILD